MEINAKDRRIKASEMKKKLFVNKINLFTKFHWICIRILRRSFNEDEMKPKKVVNDWRRWESIGQWEIEDIVSGMILEWKKEKIHKMYLRNVSERNKRAKW